MPSPRLNGTRVRPYNPATYWRLNESSGNAVDSSGNGNTATAGGTITYGVAGPLRDGSTAVTLGTDGRFVAGDMATLSAATWLLWLKPIDVAVGTKVILDKLLSGNIEWRIEQVEDDVTLSMSSDGSLLTDSITISNVLVAGVWAQIAFTWDGSALRGYRNGARVGSAVAFTGPLVNGTANVTIGRAALAAAGGYGHVSIVPSALSPDKLSRLYQDARVRVWAA